MSIILGSGGLVALITAWLTYRTNKGEQKIKWYDRAINEIERLDKIVKEERSKRINLAEELANERAEKERLKRKLRRCIEKDDNI